MSLHQIMYISTATTAVDAEQCRAIAHAAAINNRRQDVTGLLLFNSKRFLQVLEGPRDAVERIYAHIGGDHRHRALVTLREGSIATREFGDWGMAFDDPVRPTATLRDKVEALLATAGASTRAQFLGSADLHRVA